MRTLDNFSSQSGDVTDQKKNTQLMILFRTFDRDEDGLISEEELYEVFHEIVLKDMPNMTEKQMLDVISHDFAAAKAQYKEHLEKNKR